MWFCLWKVAVVTNSYKQKLNGGCQEQGRERKEIVSGYREFQACKMKVREDSITYVLITTETDS